MHTARSEESSSVRCGTLSVSRRSVEKAVESLDDGMDVFAVPRSRQAPAPAVSDYVGRAEASAKVGAWRKQGRRKKSFFPALGSEFFTCDL